MITTFIWKWKGFSILSSQSLPLPGPYSSYQRLLIHRVAAYFHLEHNIDNSGSGLVISRGEKELLSESQRVKFRDLITTNLSQETDGQRKQQRKHTRSQVLLLIFSLLVLILGLLLLLSYFSIGYFAESSVDIGSTTKNTQGGFFWWGKDTCTPTRGQGLFLRWIPQAS